jgi:hypothetical protein
VSDLFPRSNIRQRPHFQRVEIHRIRFLAMIYVSEVTLNVEATTLINRQNMFTIRRCCKCIEDTDDLTCADIFSGKQSLSVDLAISHVEYWFFPALEVFLRILYLNCMKLHLPKGVVAQCRPCISDTDKFSNRRLSIPLSSSSL